MKSILLEQNKRFFDDVITLNYKFSIEINQISQDNQKSKKSNKFYFYSYSNKHFFLFFQFFFMYILFIQQISCFDYCCCLFNKDPFRGYNIQKSQILSFDHSSMDKESIGYKMINQCHRNYNGFPSLENINLLKRDIYTIDQKQCDKDCNYFVREINEKYNIKQEANREAEAKKLKEKRKRYLNILTKKINENTNSLLKGVPCTAKINACNYKNDKGNDNRKGSFNSRNENNDQRGSNFKVLNSPAVSASISISGNSYSNVPTLADLSIDSDDEKEQSYLELDNPSYNIELRNELEKKSI